jgi:hypothetical protein
MSTQDPPPLSVPAVQDDEFRAHATLEGKRLELHLWGNADLRVKDKLDGFLAAADTQAMLHELPEVIADLRQLAFMNSSCIKALVTWLSGVQERSPAEQYRIRFLRDPDARWQSRSLQFLVAFAPKLITIE